MKPKRLVAMVTSPSRSGRPARKILTRSALIEALRSMSMPVARDPDVDPAFYEITDLFCECFGPMLADTAKMLEVKSKAGGGDV